MTKNEFKEQVQDELCSIWNNYVPNKFNSLNFTSISGSEDRQIIICAIEEYSNENILQNVGYGELNLNNNTFKVVYHLD